MTTFAIVNILALVIALVLCTGSVWALLKQKTVVDAQGNVTEIEIPVLGRLKTNYPSLGAIFIGAALTAFVVQRTPVEQDKVQLIARLLIENTQPHSAVIVGVVPRGYLEMANTIVQGQPTDISIPVNAADAYSVIAFTPNPVRPDANFTYAVVHGQALRDRDTNGLLFENKLIGGN